LADAGSGDPAYKVTRPSSLAQQTGFWLGGVCARDGRAPGRQPGGFTRVDLVVGVGVVLGLMAWLGWAFLGENGRRARCAGNLAAIGRAMQGYAGDHGGMLPPASVNVGKVQTTWDLTIVPFLVPGQGADNNSQLAVTVPRFYACPSDHLAHSGTIRSYSMGNNDMTLQNWPPGPHAATGVGLTWDKASVSRLLGDDALQQPEALPGVKLSAIPDPANTVLVAEMIAPDNTLGKFPWATVSGSGRLGQALPDGGASFHGGRFNYLMVDGHVEPLSTLQAGAVDGQAGIWTIKEGD